LRRLPAPLAALVLALLVPISVSAQTAPGGVTLEASASRVDPDEVVTLSGSVASGAAGEAVTILDAADAVVDTLTTAAGGEFSTDVKPEATTTYRAAWGTAVSDPVTVEVRATVSVVMTGVRLFDRVRVRGSIEPARPGDDVDVWLTVGGRTVSERTVQTGAAGGFETSFRVMEPGTYRAHAAVAADDLVRDAATTDADTTPLPPLHEGSGGVFVKLLEQRLLELHYRLVAAKDGRYDFRTADAVVAFHKVQGMARTFSVDAATWRALADPRTPRPRDDGKAFHFEVDQTRQVLYTVEGGEVTNILHVSTGKPSTPTRDGNFSVVRKIAGFSPNHLYYPSYFDGNRALHGWTDVPTYAASHGCVRIPYWNAIWVYGLAVYGTRVVVYH
jgi:lipoprotein-anchoring transpeptidase ErfK/SrfK